MKKTILLFLIMTASAFSLLALSKILGLNINIFSAQAAAESVSLIRENCTGYSNCYTSLSAWEAAFGGIDFGACAQGDLVCADKIAVAQIDGSWTNPDATSFTISGWTTDATRYIKIHTASAARHAGKWDDAKYRLAVYSDPSAIRNQVNYVRIEGLQINNTHSNGSAIQAEQVGTSDFQIANTIIKGGKGVVGY
ncbi:MAG: hypothetical protein AAB906_03045, partial [Patescibacteria group bacterium]